MNVFDENTEEFKERKESVPLGVHVFRTTDVGEPGIMNTCMETTCV